jgi:hypothetical protein
VVRYSTISHHYATKNYSFLNYFAALPSLAGMATNTRFPDDLDKRLDQLTGLLRMSKNAFIVEALESIVKMIDAPSDDDLHVPSLVLSARVRMQNEKSPRPISYIGLASASKVAEEPPSKRRGK